MHFTKKNKYTGTCVMDNYLIRVFYDLISFGTINKMAQRVRLSPISIRGFIKKLEENIGHKLVSFENKKLTLSQYGSKLFNGIQEVLTEIEAFFSLEKKEHIHAKDQNEKKVITISCPSSFSARILTPLISEYMNLNPYHLFNICTQETSLPEDALFLKTDAAIRGYDNSLVDYEQIHLMSINFRLYASKSYISKYGAPLKIKDLDRHRIIAFRKNTSDSLFVPQDWILTIGRMNNHVREPYISANSVETLVSLMEKGIGIASLSEVARIYHKEAWVPILPDLQSPDVGIYFVYPNSASVEVKELGEFLRNKFSRLYLDLCQ
jgi:DNA-binding transcriptional LysR family regulator